MRKNILLLLAFLYSSITFSQGIATSFLLNNSETSFTTPAFFDSFLAQDGQNKLSGSGSVISQRNGFSCIKNIDGKYYIVAMGSIDRGRDPYVYKYNPITNVIEQEFRIVMGVATNDVHRTPVLDIDGDGNLYIICEDLDHIQTHGTPLHLFKTATPFDLSTIFETTVINSRYTNPMMWINGNNMFVGARGINNTSDFIRGQWWYYTSTDLGETFSSATKVYDSGNEDLVAYIFKIYDYDGQEWFVHNERDNVNECWTWIAVFKRISGTTFGNVDGSWTKDVSVSGAITRAEIIANCMVLNSPDHTVTNIILQGGVVKTVDGIRLAVTVNTNLGVVFQGSPLARVDEVRFYTFNSGWSYNSFELPFYQQFTLPQVYYTNNNEESIDEITVLDYDGDRSGFVYRSEDNFATHVTTKILPGNFKYLIGGNAYNAATTEDQVITLAEHMGDIWEVVDEGPLDYSNVIVVQPDDDIVYPPTPPVVMAATINNGSADRLDLTFNLPTDVSTTGWTMTASGGAITFSSVTSGDMTTTPKFTLSRSLVQGETITISYDPGAGNTIGVGNSVELGTVTDDDVSNNVVTINFQDNFTGTTISTTNWDVTNPSAGALDISQNNKIIFNRTTDTGVASTNSNFLRTDNTFGRGVYAVLMNRDVGFTNSSAVFLYRVDANNDLAILQTSTSGFVQIRVRSGGATVYSLTTSVSSSNRFRIIYESDDDIFFEYFTGGEWVQMGTTQNFEIGAAANIQLGANSATADAVSDKFSFDDVYVTAGSYTGAIP